MMSTSGGVVIAPVEKYRHFDGLEQAEPDGAVIGGVLQRSAALGVDAPCCGRQRDASFQARDTARQSAAISA